MNMKTMTNTSERQIGQVLFGGSNILADLAARIRHEHEAGVLAIKRGLAHAVEAGKLLIEAREQIPHGQWLPWLREQCSVPERSARRYMELAAYAADTISANLADMAVDGATEATTAAVSTEQAAEAGDWDLVARRLLGSPFNASDFHTEDGELRLDWVRTKLIHQLNLPWIADWCISVADSTENNRPAFRLCPWDDLLETAKALVPLVQDKADRKQHIRFESESFDSMRAMQGAIIVVQHNAMWLLGNVLHEIEYREKISDEDYDLEWDETHRDVMARLDKQLAAFKAPSASEVTPAQAR
jgi:hypothetical protein